MAPSFFYLLRGIKRSQGLHSKVCRHLTFQLLNLFKLIPPLPQYIHCTDNNVSMGSNGTRRFWFPANRWTYLQLECRLYQGVQTPKGVYGSVFKNVKTDPVKRGQTIVIGRTRSPLGLTSAIVVYLNSKSSSLDFGGPLFSYKFGAFLTRKKLIRETRLLIGKGGLDSSGFAGVQFSGIIFRLTPMAHYGSGLVVLWLYLEIHQTLPSVLEQVLQKLASLLLITYWKWHQCLLFWVGFKFTLQGPDAD